MQFQKWENPLETGGILPNVSVCVCVWFHTVECKRLTITALKITCGGLICTGVSGINVYQSC